MPKIVDPEARRRDVAEAVFRVVARDGFASASLRNVADEAGLAIGSVRHYCGSHEQLMAIAFDALNDSFTARFMPHVGKVETTEPRSPERQALVEAMLAEFLPLDEQRTREIVVWLEFSIAARGDSRYRPYVRRISSGMRMIVRRILDGSRDAGQLAGDIDLDEETDRLAALIDGLALTAVTTPEAIPPERTMEVLRAHLGTLLR
ncbi:TetR family transcriptional regulator [Herbihabitans rhizosphaerae]|uniref:TetR family transcriptional regulator n=1 Tax=Herbihabitans rhizosphaerae TaxID=1872711 RepID=A0A4Q7L1Q0_9PSEU|nr:TetR family transcriptional regulator C-terminal domain-containing protein [Herbihabitans rhizosphaerae]RZS43468.1 TetR family transcriptional regulator [Herbihabitans rhizosphaerae]